MRIKQRDRSGLLSAAMAALLVLVVVPAAYAQVLDRPGLRREGRNAERRAQQADEQIAPNRADQADRAQNQQTRLTNYFADQLMLANKSEIELSQIAVERSSNDAVKQLAQTLIEDHQQLNQQLKDLAPDAAARFAQHESRSPADRPVETRTGARDNAAHDVLTRLCMINHRACANHLEMGKKMLNEYQGQDFEMAFLGMQIGQHSWLLSELTALDGVGTPEFQEIVTQARQKVEQHLQHAKSLSKKLEDDRRAS